MRNIDSLASSYWVLYQARSPPLRVFICTPVSSPTTSRLVSGLFVLIFIFTLAGEITNVRWCELLHGGCEGFTCRVPCWATFSRFLLPFVALWVERRGLRQVKRGGGACTRGRARLGRTRRKENPAVYSPATVFILISWRAFQTWKVTHTVYNYRGNQFCSSWFDSAQSV